MNDRYSVAQLSDAVNQWCAARDIVPANGQAGEEVSGRNIRYYRTIGLLDAPERGGDGFTRKHLLQLIAIRILQAQGLPLRRIRELLFGRSIADLEKIRERGAAETARRPEINFPSAGDELWRMIPVSDDFVLVSKTGAILTPEQRRAIAAILDRTPLGKENRKDKKS